MCKELPGLINIRTVRHLWHSGTGTDGEPEWNRYQLVLDELGKLGLSEHAEQIDRDNRHQVNQLWEEQQQKQ